MALFGRSCADPFYMCRTCSKKRTRVHLGCSKRKKPRRTSMRRGSTESTTLLVLPYIGYIQSTANSVNTQCALRPTSAANDPQRFAAAACRSPVAWSPRSAVTAGSRDDVVPSAGACLLVCSTAPASGCSTVIRRNCGDPPQTRCKRAQFRQITELVREVKMSQVVSRCRVLTARKWE